MGLIIIIVIIAVVIKLQKLGMLDDIIQQLNNTQSTNTKISSNPSSNVSKSITVSTQDKRYSTVNSHYSQETLKPTVSNKVTTQTKQEIAQRQSTNAVAEMYKEWHAGQVESKKQKEKLLRTFENRETDWLAQQLKYEKRAVQWLDSDLVTHASCDAQQLKQEHSEQHHNL